MSNDPVKRHELRQISKKNGDFAGSYARDLLKQVTVRDDYMKDFDLCVEKFIKGVVMETTLDMDGGRQLEK